MGFICGPFLGLKVAIGGGCEGVLVNCASEPPFPILLSCDTEAAEQESEYDTESESEEQVVNLDDNEDEMTFLRAVTTRSGRTVKVTSKFF